jgi:uncharacterized caspase-like protein
MLSILSGCVNNASKAEDKVSSTPAADTAGTHTVKKVGDGASSTLVPVTTGANTANKIDDSASGKPAFELATGRRIALVVGNARYKTAPLINPVNDARAISAALKKMNFQVILLENATISQMYSASREFGDSLRKGDVGLFFYAGHGIQIRGRNYLIPIDANIKREDEVSFNSFDAGQLLEKMETAHSNVNIVILDACRNNPFARSFRSSSQGLAQMDAPVGTYLSFATAPAKVASDGKKGNGLYTQHLLKAMRTPGLKIEEVFKRVRVNVMNDSNGLQIPWDNSSLTGDFYFIPPENASAKPAQTALLAPAKKLSSSAQSQSSKANVASNTALATKVLASTERPLKVTSKDQAKLDAQASQVLAALYQKGVEAKNQGNLIAATESFEPAAKGGHQQAMYELGMLLKIGRKPIVQDLPKSQQFFLQAAQQDYAPAQYQVAQMFAQGIGTARDCEQASLWAHKAAEAGSIDAAVLFAELNMANCNGTKNSEIAAQWFRIAADKGLANAQFSLGLLYMTGDGVAKDVTEARKWLTSSASNGNATAQFYLRKLDN